MPCVSLYLKTSRHAISCCIVDVETTGTSSWSGIVELAAVALNERGQTLGTYTSFAYPEVLDERCDRALAYNHITREMLEGAPPIVDVVEEFSRWFHNYSVTEVWSFNRPFDQGMLEKAGLYLPWKGCIMRLCREKMPRRPKDPSLATAAAHYGVMHRPSHRALDDAKAAAELFCRLHR